ncbi:MAG: TerB family tellurite resistance protein [Paracoccaceae bacterium]
MFRRILDLFHPQAQPEPLPEPDARLALGALLVRVAKSDHAYLFEEISRIDRILAARFGLNPVEAAKLRATCEKLEHEAPETERFAQVIRDSVEYPERLGVVGALWEVMMADGRADPEEEAAIRAVETALGVSEYDSRAARAAAQVIR